MFARGGKDKMASNSRTMINYIDAKNAAIHTENCKLSLNLSCSPRELQKMIMDKCGVEDSAAKRGFADHALEMFYVDHITPGNPKKAPFVLRTNDHIEMLRESESRSLFI